MSIDPMRKALTFENKRVPKRSATDCDSIAATDIQRFTRGFRIRDIAVYKYRNFYGLLDFGYIFPVGMA